MCLRPNQFFPSAPPRFARRIRASQPGQVWVNAKGSPGSQPLPGDGPGCLRYLVPAGAKETARITREPRVLAGRRRRASGWKGPSPGWSLSPSAGQMRELVRSSRCHRLEPDKLRLQKLAFQRSSARPSPVTTLLAIRLGNEQDQPSPLRPLVRDHG